MIWLLPHILSPPSSKLSLFLSLPMCRRSSLPTEKRGDGGGGGAESYNSEKAWSSINHSTHPAPRCIFRMFVDPCLIFLTSVRHSYFLSFVCHSMSAYLFPVFLCLFACQIYCCLSVCLSVWLNVFCFWVCLSLFLSVCFFAFFVCMFVCVNIWLTVCLLSKP
jgi:hypothetical protein